MPIWISATYHLVKTSMIYLTSMIKPSNPEGQVNFTTKAHNSHLEQYNSRYKHYNSYISRQSAVAYSSMVLYDNRYTSTNTYWLDIQIRISSQNTQQRKKYASRYQIMDLKAVIKVVGSKSRLHQSKRTHYTHSVPPRARIYWLGLSLEKNRRTCACHLYWRTYKNGDETDRLKM